MNMDSFLNQIKEELEKRMGTNVKIKMQEVRKNNGVIYYGLIMQNPEHNIAPTLYLNHFYELYQQGTGMEEILQGIMDAYKGGEVKESIDMDFFCQFDEVKEKIAYRLINAERNKELLEQIPHILFLDLAICFYYAFSHEKLGEGMILIHNSHMDMWGADTKTLMHLAEENTKQLFPPTVVSMKMLFTELLEEEGAPELYVLTNEKKCQGATAMLYPNILEEMADKLGGSFFILPSSIHEVILLKERGDEKPENLRSMILEANSTQVAVEEVLSDYPYYYDAKEKRVTVLREDLWENQTEKCEFINFSSKRK